MLGLPLRGSKRKLVQKELEHAAPSAVEYRMKSMLNKKLLASGNKTEIYTRNVLKKAKSEFINRNLIMNNEALSLHVRAQLECLNMETKFIQLSVNPFQVRCRVYIGHFIDT